MDLSHPAYPDAVVAAVRRFRQGIIDFGSAYLPLADFPAGSCGAASAMLAEYMRELDLGLWEYCSGDTGGWDLVSHGWLRRGSLILDVTADQFDDVTNPVVLTDDGTWCNRFKDQRLGSAGVSCDVDGEYETYKLIVDGIESSR